MTCPVPLPVPRVVRRKVNARVQARLLDGGTDPVVARVIAGRGVREGAIGGFLDPSLKRLDHYQSLPDIERASQRVADAVMQGEIMALETDHDVDGVTSHAIWWRTLVEHFGVPRQHVVSFIGHRLKEGYGLSELLSKRILAASPKPTLVITADNGSSDEARIAVLKAAGMQVIVTDHHELPVEGPPASAYAVVTPARKDSDYPDRCIAGCMVAWLLACATRNVLIDRGHLPGDAPSLSGLLDYVAVGTVADCVSLASSLNNRAVVRAGLRLINRTRRPCWRAAQGWLRNRETFVAEDLAFAVGPRINARGRLDEAMAGVHFLLADNDADAEALAGVLNDENEARKTIEHTLRDEAVVLAQQHVNAGAAGLVVWLENGHPGVQGIVASRLVEAFGRPAICLSPKPDHPDLAVGSARGVEGIHVRDALQVCHDRLPQGLVAFGGHAGAGGLTLCKTDVAAFRRAFDSAVKTALDTATLGPFILTDGALEGSVLTLATVDKLNALDPYGRAFESPVFDGDFEVLEIHPVGDGTHLKMVLATDGNQVPAIWFRARDSEDVPLPVAEGDTRHFVYRAAANEWRGRRSLQMVVERAYTVVDGPERVSGFKCGLPR